MTQEKQWDRDRLQQSIDLALRARSGGNRPYGAVLVDEHGEVLATAINTAIEDDDVTAHAEMNLVRAASALAVPGGLSTTTMYMSTQPCIMCAGAIYIAGIGRIVFGLTAEQLREIPGTQAVRLLPVSSTDAIRSAGGMEVLHLSTGREYEPHDGFWTVPA